MSRRLVVPRLSQFFLSLPSVMISLTCACWDKFCRHDRNVGFLCRMGDNLLAVRKYLRGSVPTVRAPHYTG